MGRRSLRRSFLFNGPLFSHGLRRDDPFSMIKANEKKRLTADVQVILVSDVSLSYSLISIPGRTIAEDIL